MGDLVNVGRLAVLDQVATENLCVHVPQADTPLCGREAVKRAFSRARAAFPDAYVLIDEMLSSSDQAMVRWTGRATHRGVFWGMPATGTLVTLSGIMCFHSSDGRIAELRLFFDALSLYQQLGGSLPAASA
nr:ester cyclase [Candidatus Chloroploca mongolica]